MNNPPSYIYSARAITLMTLGALSLSACQSTIHPRSARVAKPGHVNWDVHLPVIQVAPARLVGTLDGHPVESTALSGGVADVTSSWAPPMWFDGSVRYGVFDPCEIGALLSPLRVGLEARCQLLSGDVDLSFSAAGAYLPFFERGFWGRTGFDLSRHFSEHIMMSGLYLSKGAEAWWLEFIDPPEGVINPVDPAVADGPAPGLRGVRDEIALAVPLGVAWRVDDPAVEALSVGVVFRQVLRAEDTEFSICSGCTHFEGRELQIGPSVTLVLGLSGLP